MLKILNHTDRFGLRSLQQEINSSRLGFPPQQDSPLKQESVQLPDKKRNYTIFDQDRVDSFVAQKEGALPYLKNVLSTSQDEKEIVEALYITDRLIDSGVKGIPAMYPLFSKFNNTESANIQTFLAGIYRKTQVPDAFGPLVKMLIQNSMKKDAVVADTPTYNSFNNLSSIPNIKPSNLPNLPFDPNEEIGGAILEYLSTYSKEKPKIDYSA